jgi:flagellar hook capping protein FlgD
MRSLTLLAFASLAVLAFFSAAGSARAATPETVTLSPGDTQKTWQTPLLPGSTGEDPTACMEDISCDTVRIVLAAGDWTGKRIVVAIHWLSPASDWDLFVLEGTVNGELVGKSDGFVPQTAESVAVELNRVLLAPRTLVAHVIDEAGAPEMVQGVVRVEASQAHRQATLMIQNDVTFSPNVTVSAPFAARVCEPSIRVDVRGNCYVGGIRGVPAGVDLWRFDLDPASPGYDPQLRNPTYLGQPDAFAPEDTSGGRDGGGDIDISTSFPASPSATPVLTITSLALANVSSAVSTDRGENFALSPAVANVPADDRQWNESTGADTVYVLYRAPIPATGLFVQRSIDHGATYPMTALVSPTGTTPGYIDVDHANGYVYVSHISSGAVFVSRSTDAGATWKTFTADNSTSHHHLFDPVKVGDDGTVYVCWSDDHAIYLTHSLDHGVTWAPAVEVSGPETGFALFPWLEAGSAGRVAVVWYASQSSVNWDSSDWRCYASITTNATATQPTFRIAQVSDHVIHASNLSEGGLAIPPAPVGVEANRNLCDYFQVAIDPKGACVVAFSDDHNDFDGQTYVARQLTGPSLYASANGGSGVLDPVDPLPLPAPDPDLPEVSDFLHDATGNNLQPIPTDSPYDILSIDYGCSLEGRTPMLEVKMKVSDLAATPANSFWRVNFAANAPGAVADRGDQFFLRAQTSADPTQPSFVFGSAARDTSGDLVYTDLGDANAGTFDAGTKEITMRLDFHRLDPYLTHGPPLHVGSVLVGLKGQTGTLGENTARDLTRGGGSFVVCSELVGVGEAPEPEFGMSAPAPNPGRGGAAVNLSLSHAAWTDLAIFDAAGRRVRTVHAGMLPAGITRLTWDGRTDAGHPAASGVYFMCMNAAGKVRSQRLVMVR